MEKIAISTILIIGLGYLILQPKGRYHFSDSFDLWNARFIYSLLYNGRKWIDPSFKDRAYPTQVLKRSLDIVISIVEKDLVTAKESIESLRAWIFHPIHKIYLIAPESLAIRKFAKQMNCEFVLETEVGENFKEIKKYGGWVIQQIIKLNADQISNSEDILVIDADTILLRPQVFIDDKLDRYTFHIHNDYGVKRKSFIRSVLKTNTYYKLDFVTHHMIFKGRWLKELKQTLQALHQKDWMSVFLDQIKIQKGGFSEYDIYATYVFLNHPSCVRILASANTFIYRDRFKFLPIYRAVYSHEDKSLSSHSFMNFLNH